MQVPVEPKQAPEGTMQARPQIAVSRSIAQPGRIGLSRALVICLLCAVPALSTIAKDSIYLPQSNSAHFINIASKMKVADVTVVVSQPQLAEPLVAIVLQQPEARVTRQDQLEVPDVPRVSLTVCLQHRSPPLVLA
jgi:hypothetical protein